MSLVVIGLCVSVFSQFIGFTAFNIQRIAQHADNPRPTLNAFGIVLSVLVGPTDMIAFTITPQSLLAPIGTLGLVLNLAAAPRLHGDQVTRRAIFATLLTVLGTAVCLAFGAHGHPEGETKGVPTQGTMQGYVLCVGTLGVGLGVALTKLRETRGFMDALVNASLAGVLASTTVVAGKRIGQALAAAMPLNIVLSVLPLLCLAPAHLFVINRGLGRHSSIVFIPLKAAATLLANIVTGFLLYGEAPESWIYFGAGALLLLSGVFTLAKPRDDSTPAGAVPLKQTLSALERGTAEVPLANAETIPALGGTHSGGKSRAGTRVLAWVASRVSGRPKATWADESPKLV